MLDQELEAVKETQNWCGAGCSKVSLLHRDLDGLAQQVQDVKEEVQNLKHAPCDHNPSISKHRTGVEQDVAFQALQKDLENSFTELSKKQLEGVADEKCLDDIEKAFERNVSVQSKIF